MLSSRFYASTPWAPLFYMISRMEKLDFLHSPACRFSTSRKKDTCTHIPTKMLTNLQGLQPVTLARSMHLLRDRFFSI